VSQNFEAEQKTHAAFAALQERILTGYGIHTPATPVLRLRNATQTSLVLEWDPIHLATTTLRSLALYRNGSKAANIPRPLEMTSTKMSGLAVDSEYSFYLVLRTSGGTYTSNTLTVKTHSMSNLTGITVTPGVMPPPLRESLEAAVARIGARISDTVRIDTTHFVCTEGRGRDWERANEMNIPVVRPEWIEGCEREGRLIGVRGYYLDADPKQRHIGSNPSLSAAPGRPSTSGTSLPQQANVPQRPKELQTPKSPDRESSVSGEPGPEVPPTPPPKNDVPPTPAGDEDEAEDDHGEEEEGEESEEETKDRTRPEGVEAKVEEKSEATDEEEEESSVEDGNNNAEEERHHPTEEGGREGADMEEVAL
jgi:hypothetical protein